MPGPWEKYKSAPSPLVPAGDTGPWAKYAENTQAAEPDGPVMSLAKEAGGAVLNVGGRVLDYAPGMMRTAAAGIEAPILRAAYPGAQKDAAVPSWEDYKQTFLGNAPKWENYSDRMGIAEGPSANVPGIGNVSAKNVADKVTGVGLDPFVIQGVAKNSLVHALSGKAMGVEAPSALDKMIQVPGGPSRPVSGAMQKAGKNYYKSAFKNVDQALVNEGVDPVSPTLFENRVTKDAFQPQSLRTKLQDLKEKINAKFQGTIDRGEELGVTVDPDKVAAPSLGRLDNAPNRNLMVDTDKVQQLKDWVNKLIRPDREAQRAALDKWKQSQGDYINKLEGFRADQKAFDAGDMAGPLQPRPVQPEMGQVPNRQIPLRQLMTTKSELRNSLPKGAFGENGFISADGKQVAKGVANSAQHEGAAAMNAVQDGLGDEMNRYGKQLQSIIEAEDPLANEVSKEVRKNGLTEVKAGVAAAHPGAAISMYGAKALNSPWMRTNGGLLLHDIGASGLMTPADALVSNPVLRHQYTETVASKKQKSPYEMMPPRSGQ